MYTCIRFAIALYPLQAEEDGVWSEAAIARFSELAVAVPAKLNVLEMAGRSHTCTVQLYVRYPHSSFLVLTTASPFFRPYLPYLFLTQEKGVMGGNDRTAGGRGSGTD